MNSVIYDMTSFFPYNQGNRWSYKHISNGNESEVSYIIDGVETFFGVQVPKKVQEDNPDEYFCTLIDPIYGVRDFKHHIGMSPNFLVYTPPTIIIPAKMALGQIHYNTSHLFRHKYDGEIQDEGEFYDVTRFENIEDIETPAGIFKECPKLTLIRDDVFSDLVVNVIFTQWMAKDVGIVKLHSKVNIYSPQNPEPYIVESEDIITSADIDGEKI
ncbi:MAG: hypothetical protein D6734_08235 [Candidatus Schekmanbacteria bacterium]|nr:MAG: hypothetical protein D6734_08235 [Candidatus Schekmanbacteria bacterium]